VGVSKLGGLNTTVPREGSSALSANSDKSEFIYTTHVDDAALAHLDSVAFAPAIFQERVSKVADIRVTVVGTEVFATRINAHGLPPEIPDWRYASPDQLEHNHHTLPSTEAERCIVLTKTLDLEFGAIDLAIDDEGRYVFFEINPNGQWAWLETLLGLRISAAIVDHLVRHGTR
jgi:glutathione synthase/RimK-type ligase-like ATP-grasp enzyme